MTMTPDWQTLKGHVTAAFAALRKDGIYARGPVGFDKGEALAKVAEADARGFAYYHSQDAQRARGGGPLWIGFGSATEGGAAAIGCEVVTALERESLHVEWNGSVKTRLAVYLSRDAAKRAAREETRATAERAAQLRKLEADRLEPEAFFAKLRSALEELAAGGRFHVVFGDHVAYEKRKALAAEHRKTLVACPAEFLSTWDKINIDVTTHPVQHDKAVVKQIAEALRKSGFKVSYVHASYLHVRTTG